jgi:hypothetical protein
MQRAKHDPARIGELRSAIEREDLAAARALVQRWVGHASAALIPELLPALVPRHLRLQLDRRRPRRPVYEASVEEKAFGEAVGVVVASWLASADSAELVWLEEHSRSLRTSWPLDHWRALDADALESCLPRDPSARFALQALASFHPSGYVRERALGWLEPGGDGAELPYLLLRLNDWALPVQRRAFRLVRARIQPQYASHFSRWLVLIERTRAARRNDLSNIVQWACGLLVSEAGQGALEARFDAPDRRLRLAALQLASARLTGARGEAAIVRALRDRDLGIRAWAARRACDARRFELLPALDDDPCGRIRLWALRLHGETSDEAAAIPRLEAALLDRAPSVRGAARFYLSQLRPGYAFAASYRRTLEEASVDMKQRAIAIAGLGETGDRDDAALLAFEIASSSARVAKAALRACARLAPSECLGEITTAVEDRRPGVARLARRLLEGRPPSAARIADWIERAPWTHTRVHALTLAATLEPWQALLQLARAASNDRMEVRAAALVELERWLERRKRSVYRIPPPSAARLDQLRAPVAAVPEPMRARIFAFLASATGS